jgi:hypothetical protein
MRNLLIGTVNCILMDKLGVGVNVVAAGIAGCVGDAHCSGWQLTEDVWRGDDSVEGGVFIAFDADLRVLRVERLMVKG